MPAELDEVERRIMQLEIEREALRKETDKASVERLQKLEKELADLKEEQGAADDALAAGEGSDPGGPRRSRRSSSRSGSRSSRPSGPATTPRPRSCSTAACRSSSASISEEEARLAETAEEPAGC